MGSDMRKRKKQRRVQYVAYTRHRRMLDTAIEHIRALPEYEGLSKRRMKTMQDSELLPLAAKYLYSQAIDRNLEGMLWALADEWLLSLLGNPTIFIENEELAEMLFHSHFDIDPESFALPHKQNLAYYSFPRHTTIDEHNLPACYFGRIEKQQWDDAVQDVFTIAGSPHKVILRQESGRADFVLAYNSPKGLCQLYFRPEQVVESLNGDIDYDSIVTDRSELLTDESRSWGNALLRLCAAVSVYVQAFPQAYRPGLPEAMQNKSSTVRSLLAKPMKVGVYSHKRGRVLTRAEVKQAFRSSSEKRKTHWRQGTFRTLRHERFKRNPDGSMRVIFVRGFVVNEDIDPSTVEMLDVDEIRDGAGEFHVK